MTVKELIAELQKLDQDRGIWIIYDTSYIFKPKFDETVSAEEEDHYREDGFKKGDYKMEVGVG